MRIRRLRKQPATLEITAFLNLIVVLVPFLLSTAVFSRMAVLQLTLPPQSTSFTHLTAKLKLEVVIRPASIEVGDRDGGLIQRIDNTAAGYDYIALSGLMGQLKTHYPDVTEATVLAQLDTPYDVLVHVMDAMREGDMAQGSSVVHAEFFPDISIGDAPQRSAKAGS